MVKDRTKLIDAVPLSTLNNCVLNAGETIMIIYKAILIRWASAILL